MPEALASIDEPVMSGLAAMRERRTSFRSLSLACLVAGLVGLWAGVGTHGTSAHAAESLLGVPAAAPSSLLVD
jgi:hypothetical protein